MPFTPSILAEDIDEYIDRTNNVFAPYMAITFDSTAKGFTCITELTVGISFTHALLKPTNRAPDL